MGHTLSHSDVGGYTMIDHKYFKYYRSKELLLRWLELGAFAGVIYRTHFGSVMNTPSVQVWDDEETIGHFARFSRVFAHLAPYRSYLMAEAERKGYPVVRPLFLHYLDDPLALQLTSEFLVGEDLLVAPVLDSGRSNIRVYLPWNRGGWKHVWSGRVYGESSISPNGLWIMIEAPLGQPPVFYRPNSRFASIFASMAKIRAKPQEQ